MHETPENRTTARHALQRGSLSFALAARLLGPAARDGVTALYWWCRHCDDVIDGQDLGHAADADARHRQSPSRGGDAVDHLWRATHAAAAAAFGGEDQPGVFGAMGSLMREARIPDAYPWELLAGMRMDVEGASYETLADLRLYCFRVAGVVGLMYSHVAGVSDPAALRHAADLGIAMQLTNIARDVRADAVMGRLYLPREWLRSAGVPVDDVLDPSRRGPLADVVGRLLDAAEMHYRSGEAGIRYLPWRAALAAAAASRIYAEIGREVRARGERAWDRRVVISAPRKLWLVATAVGSLLRSLPDRLRHPWRPVVLTNVWRFA